MNSKVDQYLIDGCGRCKYYATPNCKVNTWIEELKILRSIALESGLNEEIKWGVPCYTFENKNIILVSAFKDYCAISFFKGTLIKDKKNLLEKPGDNSQSAMYLKFNKESDILSNKKIIKSYIEQAIEIEKSGLKVEFKKNPEPIPEELNKKFQENPEFKKAFFSLTPGRQRGYILFFSQPKQSKTREARIEKCTTKIFNGEGLNEY